MMAIQGNSLFAYIMSIIMFLAGYNADLGINYDDATKIVLSDSGITVNDAEISRDSADTVYTANDIVYYPQGKDFTFGEGDVNDAFPYEVAAKQTVIHITKPGIYELSGKLSAGQIAVDLGEDAKDNPDAVVTLVLNNADINCDVAPAVIFYNVYECGEKNVEAAKMDVDTASAGANVVIADGSVNNVSGEYVAKIYKSVELSDDGKEVVDSKKLHKYDAAFYSKMSMNIHGEENGDGILNIHGSNEGLGTELHLTINGGCVNIYSGNDGINTNEDNVSVCAVNGGELNVTVTGETGEGDGIDSNGWLVINGGKVTASACGKSADSGIDADKGVFVNGGTVIASGNMLDKIEGTQGYSVFGFEGKQKGAVTAYSIKNANGEEVVSYTPDNDFSNLVFSSNTLAEGEYSLWADDERLGVAKVEGMMGMHGGRPPMGERPDGDFKPPEGMPPVGERPEGRVPPEMPKDGKMPEGMKPPEFNRGEKGQQSERLNLEYSDSFEIKKGANNFMVASDDK